MADDKDVAFLELRHHHRDGIAGILAKEDQVRNARPPESMQGRLLDEVVPERPVQIGNEQKHHSIAATDISFPLDVARDVAKTCRLRGVTPHRLLREIQIKRACEVLGNTTSTLD